MTITAGPIVWDQPLDPSDVLDYTFDVAGLLEPGENIASFDFGLTDEATALGLIIGEGAYATTQPTPTSFRIWFSIDPAKQSDPQFIGAGVQLGITVDITTDSVPPRRFDRTLVLTVAQQSGAGDSVSDLVLTGYTKPLPEHLVMRYPAFSSVSMPTIQYWLTDAERSADRSWSEGDYAAALMALAAHNMALAGFGSDNASLGPIPVGLTRMKSGSLELGFTDAAANARMTGSLAATRYGQEYQTLLRRNRGGPFVQPTGVLPTFGYPAYPQGEE